MQKIYFNLQKITKLSLILLKLLVTIKSLLLFRQNNFGGLLGYITSVNHLIYKWSFHTQYVQSLLDTKHLLLRLKIYQNVLKRRLDITLSLLMKDKKCLSQLLLQLLDYQWALNLKYMIIFHPVLVGLEL